MKKITLLLFAFFTCWQINAQVSGYSFSETTETYAQITGTTSTATGDDGTQTNIPIGFAFNYGGINYTAFGITTNGIIRLGTNATDTAIASGWTNTLSNTSANRPLIAAFWDDNNMTGGEIRYSLTGTAPNQVLTVNWHNSKIGSIGGTGGASVSTLLRLYETTNVIEIVYSNPFTTTNTVSASVGLNDATSFLSVTPAATSTVSSATANNAIDATVMANLAGKKLVFTPPSCVSPTGFSASAITTNSATISWNAAVPVPATGYQYYYSDINTAPSGAGTPTMALTANLTLLNTATVYYVWLRSDCGGSFSAWSGPFTFTTNCNSLTTLPHSESFDAVALPTCWSTSLLTGATNWASDDTNDGVPTPHSGARFMGKSWVGNDDALLVSPVYNLTSYSSNQVRLNVWIYRNTDGLSTDRTTFYANTNPNITGATQLLDISLLLTEVPTEAAVGWYNYTVIIPNIFITSGDFYIIARGRTTSSFSSYGIGFDDYTLELVPATAPTCSTISTPANNALNVAIESNISWAANVDATGYYLQIGSTSGGSDVLANTDLGNVLTYNPPVDLDYSTSYFVTLTPYNVNGSATGCTETTFTTRDAPPTGSVCSDPIIINPATLPYTTTDNTNLYGDDYENGSTQCSSFYMSGDDVVYTITPATNMSVDIVLSNLGGTYSGIHVLDGCPNSTTPPNCVAFGGDSGTGVRDLQDISLTGGTTYYIVISTWAAPQSTSYTLTITQNTCVNPTVTFSSPNNCPTATFNAVANITNLGSATSLTITDNQGSPSQNTSATGNITFGPYPMGTNVVLTVTNDQDGTCSVVSSNLTIAACPPSNDECASAIAVNCGDVITGTTAVGATNSGNNTSADVWYSYSGAAGDITVSLCTNTTYDSYLRIFDACGGTQLAFNDDGCGAQSTVTFTANGSSTYLIMVEGFGANTGAFEMTVTCVLSNGDFNSNSFKAYPNPVKDVLNVSYNTEISKVQVINMLGQVVIDRKMNATEGQIDMIGLNSGAYIVNVTVGDTVKAIKVIKQ